MRNNNNSELLVAYSLVLLLFNPTDRFYYEMKTTRGKKEGPPNFLSIFHLSSKIELFYLTPYHWKPFKILQLHIRINLKKFLQNKQRGAR